MSPWVIVITLLVTACTSSHEQTLPPPAEPAASPPTVVPAKGTVFHVGEGPEGIIVDAKSRTLAVGVRNPNSLLLFDADTDALRVQVPLPGVLRHLQSSGDGGPILVPDESSNSLIQVGLPDGRIEDSLVTGSSPHDASRAPNDNIFVANEQGKSTVVIRNNQIIKIFNDVVQPAGLAVVGNVMGNIDVRKNTLSFYDTTGLTRIAELPAGAGPTHLISDTHGRMIATDTRGNALKIFDPTGRPRLLKTLAMPGKPYGIAYDSKRDALWVTATEYNQVAGFDMSGATPREFARIPTVRQPNTVAVDTLSGKLFITGTTDSEVQVIDTSS